MEIKLQRIQKIAYIANIVCKVLSIMCIVGACLTVAGAISYLLIGDLNIKIGSFTLNGILSETEGMTKSRIICEHISAFAESVIGAVLFGFAEAFLKNELSEGTPFNEKSAKSVLKIGVLTCVLPLVGDMVTSAAAVIMKTEIEFESHYDIFAGLLLIVVSLILSYGSELEKNKNTVSAEITEKEN